MKTTLYRYKTDGFEAVLYDAENGDDRLLIVIQGLKGLELPSNQGRTVIVSTHDPELIVLCCDYMLCLERDRVKYFGEV